MPWHVATLIGRNKLHPYILKPFLGLDLSSPWVYRIGNLSGIPSGRFELGN
jgi:hypothetical protein